MIAYNEDCAEKDEIIKKQTHVVSTQTKRVKELLKKIEDLKKKIEKKFTDFHDIAEVIDPDYEMNGYLNSEKYEDYATASFYRVKVTGGENQITIKQPNPKIDSDDRIIY